ncbi:DUF5610 domain-containing protein [Shewanella litorisediminis]|uniref:DUF5610 domain-containing protein n=1 Tax=Shewanella litorisediminis TaxID=1173586 RepID=A0ABX7G569_9GAMM|nr:DUF5610 domain-containing protein [Shewanella litorisediminis]MCL2917991.1 DUF5610 domain-containing protein [Shewanella litorisediminis]QRH02424.1 DUF5610 domain-containing protein [Shewanella litorisediminis]
MEIRPSQPNHGATVSQVAKDKSPGTGKNHGESVAVVASQKTAAHSSRALMNAAILSAQQEVNLSAANEPMVLLYRAAIEAINEQLAPTQGEQAIERLAEEGVDTSPEATAGRIVDFATQFFSVYQSQNSSQSFEQQLEGFMGVIGGAIDQGFKEARDILDGLKVLEGDIAAGVDKTYDLVQQGLKDFAERMNPQHHEESTAG